jgi:hypothetical protein
MGAPDHVTPFCNQLRNLGDLAHAILKQEVITRALLHWPQSVHFFTSMVDSSSTGQWPLAALDPPVAA